MGQPNVTQKLIKAFNFQRNLPIYKESETLIQGRLKVLIVYK